MRWQNLLLVICLLANSQANHARRVRDSLYAVQPIPRRAGAHSEWWHWHRRGGERAKGGEGEIFLVGINRYHRLLATTYASPLPL